MVVLSSLCSLIVSLVLIIIFLRVDSLLNLEFFVLSFHLICLFVLSFTYVLTYSLAFSFITLLILQFIPNNFFFLSSRSAGVSNFGVNHLKEMEKAGLPIPAVNQIELNPFWRLDDIVNHCLEKGIAPMGYCPLFRGRKNNDPVLIEMASR